MKKSPSAADSYIVATRELRVLVVEDDVSDTELIVSEVRKAGFDANWDRVANEAQYLAALDSAPDLIIADFTLPQFNGMRALDLLIEQGLEIPFILVSGAIGQEHAVMAIQRGADDYVSKGDLTRLGPAIRRGLEIRRIRQERKQALEEAHRTEREYRTLVDTLPMAMYSTDASGHVTLFNEAAAEMWGRRPEPGTHICDCFAGLLDLDGKAIPVTQSPVAQALSERHALPGAAYLLVRPDGTRRHVLSYPHPVFSEDHELTGVVSLLMDVTELKQAEQALLASKVFFQATIDSVSAQICVIDDAGKIVAVNMAWQEFCQENHPQPEQCTTFLGHDYLATSEATFAPEASDAAAMTAGIRQVLDGEATEFILEYRSLRPTQERWFQAKVTRFRDSSRNIVVAHQDITERKQTLSLLEARESEQRLLIKRLETKRARLIAAQRVAQVGSWETDLATMLVTWSDETHRIHETDPALFLPTHQAFLALIHPADREAVDTAFMQSFIQSFDQDPDHLVEHRLLMTDGRMKHVEERWQIHFDTQGKPLQAIGTCQDVTERKQSELRIQRQNRVYAVLSQINTLIIRVRDREELFTEACRIAVEEGGFRMAMIATIDRASNKLVPVATAGKDDALLSAIRDVLSSEERASTTMVSRAIRDKTAIVSNDSERDSGYSLKALYTRAGVRSLAVLPLLVSDTAVGVLVFYAGEPDFFHQEEMKLLTELAEDVAFAIDHLDKQERLDYVASYDQLTGLANRRLFLERLAHCMLSAGDDGRRLALVLIDLERFKDINDTLGQPAGDAFLRQVAEWLTEHIGDVTRIARIGADQFAVGLRVELTQSDVERKLEAMVEGFLTHPFGLDGNTYRMAAKFGVAIFPDDGADAASLFKNAEAALKKAKSGGHRSLFYTQDMTQTVAQRLNLENQLRQALDNEEFVLHYQPKVDLQSRKVVGVEALIRWTDPRTGLVPPGRFIPILEETGLIYDVGRWALQQSLKDYLRWHHAGLRAVRIAVNVSPLQLRHPGFITLIKQIVATDEKAAQGLELEITEGMIMDDIKQAISSLDAIRALGIPIAIDDFGTGFSSLGYLSKLPIDTLKIDRMFISGMSSDPHGLSLVSTIINLAHSLKLKVVAEGVETEEQYSLLRLLKCDEMQGYLFSKPIPAGVLEEQFLALKLNS
jgi:diguanylate cyclase (GGDEF)-like protein/PAS domain S-box-containing protein